MASPSDSKENIAEVEANIRAVGAKQERVEAALDGSGLYLGTTDHVRQGVVSCCLALDSQLYHLRNIAKCVFFGIGVPPVCVFQNVGLGIAVFQFLRRDHAI